MLRLWLLGCLVAAVVVAAVAALAVTAVVAAVVVEARSSMPRGRGRQGRSRGTACVGQTFRPMRAAWLAPPASFAERCFGPCRTPVFPSIPPSPRSFRKPRPLLCRRTKECLLAWRVHWPWHCRAPSWLGWLTSQWSRSLSFDLSGLDRNCLRTRVPRDWLPAAIATQPAAVPVPGCPAVDPSALALELWLPDGVAVGRAGLEPALAGALLAACCK